jgi:predicted protein tyrosine phosphatase
MKTILKTVKNFIVGEPIPEKVLTLLFSGDQESVNLAFTLLDIDAHDLTRPTEMVREKRRLMKRLKKELRSRDFIIQLTPDYYNYGNEKDIKLTVRKLTPAEKYAYI